MYMYVYVHTYIHVCYTTYAAASVDSGVSNCACNYNCKDSLHLRLHQYTPN